MIESKADSLLADIKKNYEKYMGKVREIYNNHMNDFESKENWSIEEKRDLEIFVEIKNVFARLEIDADSVKEFFDSIRCNDSEHKWKPLFFSSVCTKCGVNCRHEINQSGKCSICRVEFEDDVAPFGMSSIKHKS